MKVKLLKDAHDCKAPLSSKKIRKGMDVLVMSRWKNSFGEYVRVDYGGQVFDIDINCLKRSDIERLNKDIF